jgi:hypothetical protein
MRSYIEILFIFFNNLMIYELALVSQNVAHLYPIKSCFLWCVYPKIFTAKYYCSKTPRTRSIVMNMRAGLLANA